MELDQLVEEFGKIFAGSTRAYGTYKIDSSRTGDGKKVGKAQTIRGNVVPLLWRKHLSGEQRLGIIPIRDDNTCVFGAIDVDLYDGNALKIANLIYQKKLPLIPCLSKSGGLHAYLFVREPVEAGLMQSKLREYAALLGVGTSEIFPKQTQILADRGDIGQWINMPYFGGTDNGTVALSADAEPLGPDGFLSAVRLHMVGDAGDLSSRALPVKTDELRDGPPCLQFLITVGFPEGTRNDGLYNLGVYLKKAFPDVWKQEIETYNHKFLKPPLSSTEVQGVIKSLDRKDYNYTCNKVPIQPHCNSPICRMRKHGIGSSKGMPVLNSLTKIETQPPIWFIDIEGGGRLQLTTEDLQNPIRFQKRCMEMLNTMPPILNRLAWQQIIQQLMDEVNIVEMPTDAKPQGQLHQMLENFLTSKAQARDKEELLLGKPWANEGRHYFRIADFMEYLRRYKYDDLKLNEVVVFIRSLGGTHAFFNIKGKGVNAWSIPEMVIQSEGYNLPDGAKEPKV